MTSFWNSGYFSTKNGDNYLLIKIKNVNLHPHFGQGKKEALHQSISPSRCNK